MSPILTLKVGFSIKQQYIMTDMKSFDAKQARDITNGLHLEDVEGWLVKIRAAAAHGKAEIHIEEHISDIILKELESRGFKVYRHPSIAIQKESLYYTIGW